MSKDPVAVSPGTVTAYITVKNAAEAIAFYKAAFDASEDLRLESPDGKISHAEIRIGHTQIMLSDEHPDFGALSPQTVGGNPVKFHLAVENADAAVAKAVKAGGTVVRELKDEFYGERTGQVADPFGYVWFIGQKTENLSEPEVQDRWKKMMMG